MRRVALFLVGLAVGVGLLVAVLIAFTTVPRQRVVDGYVLFAGGLLLFGLVRATRHAGEADEASSYERALRRRERQPSRPRELSKLEREVGMAATSSFDLHYRLRPVLREIAAHRLATRRGLALDGGSAEVPAALGPELWEIVRADRPSPDDRFAPGLPLDRQRILLDRLERI